MTTSFSPRAGPPGMRNRLWRLAGISALVLASTAACSPAACSSKGWDSNTCAEYGEFSFNGKVLRIPNKPPDHYRWFGRLRFNPTSKTLTSPVLAVRWRNNRPAGSQEDSLSRPSDFVSFQLIFSDERRENSHVTHTFNNLGVQPLASKPTLPFEVPRDLELMTSEITKRLYFVNDSTTPDVLLSCPQPSPKAKGQAICHGWFYPQRGLLVDFSMAASELKDWRSVTTYLKSLISSWETN